MALVLMCGLSFAGKSTAAGRLAHDLPARLISLDAINEERGLHGGQGIPLDEWATTNRIAHERVTALLAEGSHVVVDDTGSPRFIRDQWRAVAGATGAAFAIVWVHITPETQIERVRANRDARVRHDVTDEVLRAHAASFEPPTEEGAFILDASETDDDDRLRGIARAIGELRAR